MRHLSKRLPIGPASAGYRKKSIEWINSRRRQLAGVSDEDLKAVARDAHTLPETFAVTAVLAERLLGFKMFACSTPLCTCPRRWKDRRNADG